MILINNVKRSFDYLVRSGDLKFAWLVVLLLLSTLLIWSGSGHPLGDAPIYRVYSESIWHGLIPYKDFHIEYPPGTLPIVALAQPLGHLFGSYFMGFSVLSGLVIFFAVRDVYRNFGRIQLLFVCAALLILGSFTFFHLDIFSAVALYFCLRTLRDKKYGKSAILLGAATLIKAYPLMCLPAILLYLPHNRAWLYIRNLALTIMAGLLPFVLISPKGFWYAISFHIGRSIEIDSGPAALGFLMHLFGQPISAAFAAGPSYRGFHSGFIELVFPHSLLIGTYSSLILVVALLALSVYLAKLGISRKPATSCLAILMLFIIFFKVGSPQFLLLPILLIPLTLGELGLGNNKRLWIRMLLISLVVAVTMYKFSIWNPDSPQAIGGFLVILRTILEVELLVWLIRNLRRQ